MPAVAAERASALPAAGSSLAATAWSLPAARWSLLALVLFVVGGIAQLVGLPSAVWWVLYLACYAAGGWEPALAGLQALRERTLDVDVLMVVAALAAAAIGQVVDGALLIVIFATSGALEAFVTRRTSQSVDALLGLAPSQVIRLLDAGHSEEVDVESLEVGDVVLVRPGERVGADGDVVDGDNEVDESSVTGEPLPVTKRAGTAVYAGTVNGTGALQVRVSRPAHDSVVARIASMVESASATKARRQLYVERVEQRYSVVVVVATLGLLGVPLLAGESFQPALLRAMTFMIVASPCAVVLATMPPLLAVIANAGRHGVLVKSAVALEALHDVDVVAFDKTGTLTHGRPTMTHVAATSTLEEDEVLALAASAEAPSEHPLGRAVVRAARERGVLLSPAQQFEATPGRAASARVRDHEVTVGSPGLGTSSAAVRRAVEEARHGGGTACLVLVDGEAVGVLTIRDEVRATAPAAVARLRTTTVLLTGDHESAAREVASYAVISDVRAGLLPDEKAAVVAGLQREGHGVAFVGDGINDAPAMATATVGVAFGSGGSDLAVETADVVVVRDDLTAVPALLALADRARRVVGANLVFAACVIVGLVAWDVLGTLPLPLGVAGHEGSTVVVGLNGLRLLRSAAWPSRD